MRIVSLNLLSFAACVLSCAMAYAQPPRVSALEWLSGTWVQASGEEHVTEAWLGPGNGTMVAANLTVGARGRRSFEFLRIADTEEGFSYYASPGGRASVEFKLKEIADRRVVFENAAHDFPQRVLYWREGEELVARIEGTVGGRQRHRSWRYKKG